MNLARRAAAEGVGAAFLLLAVVGSGIMGERLSHGEAALTLLANSLATGAALLVLILCLGPISGAHFNPAVTLTMALRRALPWRDVAPYLAAQIIGACVGVAAAHLMFEQPAIEWSRHARSGPAQLFSEFVATFGLVGAILAGARYAPTRLAEIVAAYITAAYWFTSSTSFANPAAAIARALTDSFAGIRAADVPLFILAQLAGAAAASCLFGWMVRDRQSLDAVP